MSLRAGLLTSVLFTTVAWADGPGDRDRLLGTWEVQGGTPAETWTLAQKGDVQTIVRTEGGQVTLNLKCKPTAGECHGVDSGKSAKVTMYTSGPSLVQWEVKDTNLIIRRFFLDGQALTIEARQVTGQSKSRALRLIRRLERTAKH